MTPAMPSQSAAVEIESKLAAIPPLDSGEHADLEHGACIMDAMEQKLRNGTQTGSNGCLLWTGYIQPNGYGYVNLRKTKMPAHRLAVILSGRDVPRGMDVCHKCDVRNCVNPDHLYVGTRKQNMADCTERQRHNKPSGEKNWRAKLSSADVRDIRASHKAGHLQQTIADRFSVHPSTVSRIARGLWRGEVA